MTIPFHCPLWLAVQVIRAVLLDVVMLGLQIIGTIQPNRTVAGGACGGHMHTGSGLHSWSSRQMQWVRHP